MLRWTSPVSGSNPRKRTSPPSSWTFGRIFSSLPSLSAAQAEISIRRVSRVKTLSLRIELDALAAPPWLEVATDGDHPRLPEAALAALRASLAADGVGAAFDAVRESPPANSEANKAALDVAIETAVNGVGASAANSASILAARGWLAALSAASGKGPP